MNIFWADDQEKKQEIQIGAPTDVKHVAHIGCDGTAEESPSWVCYSPTWPLQSNDMFVLWYNVRKIT